jgi:hypothetical protein
VLGLSWTVAYAHWQSARAWSSATFDLLISSVTCSGYAFQATKQLHRILLCVVCSSVVDLRIELSATRLSAGYGQPALDYHLVKSGTSGSNRDPPAPKAGVLPSAPLPESLCQWTCRELNPEALSASQSVDPSASPLVLSATRVGFEPDLAGLKDQ